MAAPQVLSHYPANAAIGVPISTSFEVIFDAPVDFLCLERGNVFLSATGKDSFSGIWGPHWFSRPDINNPLDEPAYEGLVTVNFEKEYLGTNLASVGTDFEDVGTDPSIEYYTKVRLKPVFPLAPNAPHRMVVVGTSTSVSGIGIHSRTVFDPMEVQVLGDGDLFSNGIWSGAGTSTYAFRIQNAGELGSAKYTWRKNSGVWSISRPTHGRMLHIDDGLQVSFSRYGTFAANDEWHVITKGKEYLAGVLEIDFVTGGQGSLIPAISSATDLSEAVPGWSPSAPLSAFGVQYQKPISICDFATDHVVFYFNKPLSTAVDESGIVIYLGPPNGDLSIRGETSYSPDATAVVVSGTQLSIWLEK